MKNRYIKPIMEAASIKAKIPERDIKAAIRKAIRISGWTVFYIQQGPFSHKGIADIIAIKSGRHVWIEVKTATGIQSPFQKKFEADVRAAGGEYIIARDLEDIDRLLDCVIHF